MVADIHTCSYACDNPPCIKRQRGELLARIDALTADAERLDFIRPGFKVLAGDHVMQLWWQRNKQSRVVSVPVNTPDAIRALFDAARQQEPAREI